MTYQTSDWLYINDHIFHKDTFRGVTFEGLMKVCKMKTRYMARIVFFPAVSSERQTNDNEITDFLNKTVSPFFVVFFLINELSYLTSLIRQNTERVDLKFFIVMMSPITYLLYTIGFSIAIVNGRYKTCTISDFLDNNP